MKRAKRSDLKIGSQTHPGEKRTNNEDNLAVAVYAPVAGTRMPVTLALVADGIGGHQAGEVASGIAARIIPQTFDRAQALDYRALFSTAFEATSAAIANHAAGHPEAKGLGTTCVAALVFDRSLYTAAVGDSRIYLLRDGALRQLTVDHSWVQEAQERGIISAEEARNHPRRNVLRRHLGAGADATPDFRLRLTPDETDEQSLTNQGLPLQTGDRIMLCSDGLTDLVPDEAVQTTLLAESDTQAAVEELVRQARAAGGNDNITVVILDVPSSAWSWLLNPATWFLLFFVAMLVLGLFGLAVVVVFGLLNLQGGAPLLGLGPVF